MFSVETHGPEIPTYRKASIRSARDPSIDGEWNVPEEVPVAFVYSRRNYAIMLATPDDLVDYAIGFSLSERVIDKIEQIKSIDIHNSEKGVDFRIEIDKERLERLDVVQRRRNLIGSASCGLCGLENADTLLLALPKVADTRVSLNSASVEKSLTELSQKQELNRKTRTVHAAAWADFEGNIKLIREDVGRHNALDKLIGAMAQADVNRQDGFALMSSRCSYELVEKAATYGITAMVTVSAPTGFALRKAKEANLALYARSDRGAVELI